MYLIFTKPALKLTSKGNKDYPCSASEWCSGCTVNETYPRRAIYITADHYLVEKLLSMYARFLTFFCKNNK